MGFDRLSLSGAWGYGQRKTSAQAEPVEARARRWPLALIALTLLGAAPPAPAHSAASKDIAAACGIHDGWSDPAPPAHIFGNTWYVGTCGITVVLIATNAGLVLIDSGPEDAAPLVLANIAALGFDPKQVKWLLSTHEHFDHAGGLAALEKATGAKLAVGPFAAQALRTGKPSSDDPQFDLLKGHPMKPARVDRVIADRGSLALGDTRFTALATPAHTSGSTSWYWTSCEDKTCETMSMADSVNAISADGYRFMDHLDRHTFVIVGIGRIANMPCGVLLTPHPGQSNLLERLSGRAPLTNHDACRAYAAAGMERYKKRLEHEDVPK